MTRRPRAYARHDPRQAWGRLILAVVAGVVTGLAIPWRLGPSLRAVAAWDVTAIVLVIVKWMIIFRSTHADTRHRAAADDPGRTVVWAIVLVASSVSLFATSVSLRQARMLAPEARDLFAVLCVLAVAGSWLLTHTAYTLRYAHLYYRDDDEGEGGLAFPGDDVTPAYFDFAYFALTIGMCFQVSDVTISSHQIRRAVLSQALLSFVYNTVILAVALNLVLGIFG
jgi:uncharacterized membrane protein